MNLFEFEESLAEVNEQVEEIQSEIHAYHLEEKKRKEAEKNEDMKHVTLASSFVLLYVLWSTYDIGTKLDPKEHTISQIGNYGFRLEFIIWGITTGALFLWYILRLFELEDFENKHVVKWVGLSSLFLLLTVLTPSMPELFPVFQVFHVIWAGSFGIFLLLAMVFFVKFLAEDAREVSVRAFWGMGIVVFGTLLLIVTFGNVAIWEMFFVSGIVVFLFLLTLGLERHDEQEELLERMKFKKKKDN